MLIHDNVISQSSSGCKRLWYESNLMRIAGVSNKHIFCFDTTIVRLEKSHIYSKSLFWLMNGYPILRLSQWHVESRTFVDLCWSKYLKRLHWHGRYLAGNFRCYKQMGGERLRDRPTNTHGSLVVMGEYRHIVPMTVKVTPLALEPDNHTWSEKGHRVTTFSQLKTGGNKMRA